MSGLTYGPPVPGMALLIENQQGKKFLPVVKDGVSLAWERKGTPGLLRFTLLKEGDLNFHEGDRVKMSWNGYDMFYGFVFEKKRTSEGPEIDVVAYDQLRYFKNKDTYIAESISASELLQRIAGDFNLNLGSIEDTGYQIPLVEEDNQSLFDIVNNALDETVLKTGNLFILYDDVGKITLKNASSMEIDLLIDDRSAQSFDYTSSIDKSTFTRIKMTYDNKETGKREVFKGENQQRINEWGVLQFYQKRNTPEGAPQAVNTLLKLYGDKTRSLTIKGAFGDPKVRPGVRLKVHLSLGDQVINQRLMVEKVTHTFEGVQHWMDLSLVGDGGFT